MDILTMFVIPVAVGFVVGLLSGLLGIGGGTLLLPVYKLGFGLSAIACTGTSLFTIIPTSLSGIVEHLRRRTCVWKLGVAAGLGGACTSPFGVSLAMVSPSWLIMVVAAAIIAYSAITMLNKAIGMGKGKGKGKDAAAPASAEEPVPEIPSLSAGRYVIGGLIGAAAGVASGYVGVGGGFLIVPLFISLLHIPMKLTSGTSLLAILFISVPGVVTQALAGNIAWAAGICVAVGSVPGALLGARLMTNVPERGLRFLFAGLLLVSAAMLVINETIGA